MVGASVGLSGNRVEDRTGRLFLISGKVQGVGYRGFAAEAARRLGVAGWARNLADGRVAVEASGTAQQLEELEAFLRSGPRYSDVRGVEVGEVVVSERQGFIIHS